MGTAVLLVGALTIVLPVVGIVSPESVTTVRRAYFATPCGGPAEGPGVSARVAAGESNG